MRRTILRGTSLLLVAWVTVLAGLLLAGPIGVSFAGFWNITLTVSSEKLGQCLFEGTARVFQTDSTVTGTVDVQRAPGSSEQCPTAMSATISGSAMGSALQGVLDGGGNLGSAEFVGNLQQMKQGTGLALTASQVNVAGGNPAVRGSSNVLEGPFSGLMVDFNATHLDVTEVPAFNEVGIAAMTALLLSATLLLLRRSVI